VDRGHPCGRGCHDGHAGRDRDRRRRRHRLREPGYFPTIVHALDPETSIYLATGEDLVAAIGDGWTAPDGSIHFLHGSCPGADDVFGALAGAGVPEPTKVGTIERYEVWRWEY
jgi:hypothetical protein